MTVNELIATIMAEFPDALQSEVADALCITDRHVSPIIRMAVGQRGTPHRKKDLKIVRQIEKFAEATVGGEIEIIVKSNNCTILCVDGRVVA